MSNVKRGDTVKVHYTGKLDDGAIFDTTDDRDPIQFTIGDGNIIAGFEQAVVGMHPGESKTVKVSADRAFGPHHQELVIEVDKKEIVDEVDPEIGQRLQVNQPDGQKFLVTVTEISESRITLDANHPLAGKDLTFEIQLLEVV